MTLIERISNLFFKKKDEEKKKDDGVKMVYEPSKDSDPKELKGTKLSDCTFQSGCPALS